MPSLSTETSIDYFLNNAPLILVISVFACFLAAFLYTLLRQRQAKPFLDSSLQRLRLIDKVPITHDTLRLRFELPDHRYCIGLPPGKHIKIFGPNWKGVKEGHWNGVEDRELMRDQIERKYTPITGNEFPGFVDFVIKIYRGGIHDRFPDGGKMSQRLSLLELGDYIDIMGPIGLLTYHGHGRFTHGQREYQKKKLGLVAGGTGITPMLQIIRHILNDRTDHTEIWLIFANRTEEDILLQNILEDFASHHSEQFHLWYTVEQLTLSCKKWNFSLGFVDIEMMKEHLPKPGEDSLVLLCGPPAMTQFCKPNLARIGWSDNCVLEF